MVPDVLHVHTVLVSLIPKVGSKHEEQDSTISEIGLIQVGSENEPSFVFPKNQPAPFPLGLLPYSFMVSVA